MAAAPQVETLTHRLVLPRDANHHGSLYAGVLLSFALEAAYATAYRAVGQSANLVLKRLRVSQAVRFIYDQDVDGNKRLVQCGAGLFRPDTFK